MTEQQKYTVLQRCGDAEIRAYPQHTVAEVVVDGDFDSAGNKGFRPLFNYISGGKVSMTAPVVQTPGQAAGEQGHAVAFVMPADRSPDSLPAPSDSRVHLRVVPQRTAAALRFSGSGNARDLERRSAQLHAALVGSTWTAVGPVRLARFNAPFVPPFLRHNEVVVDVDPVLGDPAG
ncbi:MAG: heme-binding protein [Candidatus Nanopelagicales bacterium]